jgi:hypothetical protein
MREGRNAYRILVGELLRKCPLSRPKRKRKMSFEEVGCEDFGEYC